MSESLVTIFLFMLLGIIPASISGYLNDQYFENKKDKGLEKFNLIILMISGLSAVVGALGLGIIGSISLIRSLFS